MNLLVNLDELVHVIWVSRFGKATAVEGPQQPDRDLLFSLATMNRDLGRYQQARDFANKLVVAFPQDSAALRLRDSLK